MREKNWINLVELKLAVAFLRILVMKKKAWQLIKEAGCDDLKEGDAMISKKHCNFFVNNGKANSDDIEKLIDKVRKRVNDKTGVNLELEIKIIGDKKKFKNVLVVLGGTSGEREVSLESGRACIEALKKKKYIVSKFDPKFKNLNLIDKRKTDVIFNALHGKDGEDGIAQSYFEYLGIPYTHSGVVSSYNAMNKIISKKIFLKK